MVWEKGQDPPRPWTGLGQGVEALVPKKDTAGKVYTFTWHTEYYINKKVFLQCTTWLNKVTNKNGNNWS